MDIYAKTEDEVPEHLQGLKDLLRKSDFSKTTDEEYAKIGFTLLNAANGDKDAIRQVSNFIQIQQMSLKILEQRHSSLLENTAQWMYWASVWTVRKPA